MLQAANNEIDRTHQKSNVLHPLSLASRPNRLLPPLQLDCGDEILHPIEHQTLLLLAVPLQANMLIDDPWSTDLALGEDAAYVHSMGMMADTLHTAAAQTFAVLHILPQTHLQGTPAMSINHKFPMITGQCMDCLDRTARHIHIHQIDKPFGGIQSGLTFYPGYWCRRLFIIKLTKLTVAEFVLALNQCHTGSLDHTGPQDCQEFPVESKIDLKIGAQVMLLQNLGDNLANGSTGRVIGLFKSGQLPLTLAWAMTVHKSQSLTLDKVVVDLDKAFADGVRGRFHKDCDDMS
ncbi:hypothetical protein P692DRAFT_20820476 [Suillus brevipes Sb2]|nr:hypothetical protein P692DRAFT_20820476 [Suillus brevipes Sb2]